MRLPPTVNRIWRGLSFSGRYAVTIQFPEFVFAGIDPERSFATLGKFRILCKLLGIWIECISVECVVEKVGVEVCGLVNLLC